MYIVLFPYMYLHKKIFFVCLFTQSKNIRRSDTEVIGRTTEILTINQMRQKQFR